MSDPLLLVVDDDPEVVSFVEVAMRPDGAEVLGAASGEEALDVTERAVPDAVFLDVRLPGIDGLETLRRLRGRLPEVPVVMITSHASMEATVEAMKEGAHDFLTKPLRVGAVESVVRRLSRARPTGPPLAVDIDDGAGLQIVGKSPAMVEVYKTIGRVARADATVLITGESGTGKELVARVIHESSRRREQPFLAVNCAAIPENLLESELFGHEKGAFTGSVERRIGKFERAHGGTLLLDEIGDLALPLQGKILRALEEAAIERVGGSRPLPIDVRLLAATNQRLLGAVERGAFREDLYYRLAVVTVELPPLRARTGDVRLLVDFFVSRSSEDLGRPIERIEPEVYERLERHSWPGNVRELQNVLKRGLILGRGPVLTLEDLPPLGSDASVSAEPLEERLREACREGMSLRELEKRYYRIVLEESGGNRMRAAEILRVHRNTVRRKIADFGPDEIVPTL